MKELRLHRALSAAAFLGVAALAQTPTPPPQPTFRTEANYVRVDVFPTRDDAPISDLTQADFEIFEGGAPQRIEQFEHVQISGGVPQETRREPNTVAESRQAAQNPRARVFVVFLDTNHVGVEGSHNIRQPLVDALDKLIGPEDLVAVMTPNMAASDITFARKTTTIAGFLARYWTWGERNQLVTKDPVEENYRLCYPGNGPSQGCRDDDRGVADEMIERRREKLTIDALHDLVRYLRGVREERKAVIAISDGWRLFPQNQALARQLGCSVPRTSIGIDPRTAKPTANPVRPGDASQVSCDGDRQTLAYMDDERSFRDLLDEANAANTSFYPVDPRGLVVFDEPIMKFSAGRPTPMTPLPVDAARLRSRLTSLRTLADATDGLAIVDSNNLAEGFRRVVADLSSYYLLGYYSTGKLDGRFHPITVRVKRPGVNVRARRGYLAATPEAMSTTGGGRGPAAAKAGVAPEAEAAAAAEAHAIESAIGPLAGYARDVPLRLQVAAGWKPGDTTSSAMWVVGELGGVATVGDTWNDGFEATLTLTTAADATVASGRASVARGVRTFRVPLTASQPLPAGDYVLRVGARAGPASIPTRDTLRITVPAAPDAAGAIFIRRGPGNREVPTADLRFRRSEQLRVEIPTTASDAVTARLLDRTGKPLAVPVTAALRDDADGSRWQTAQLALAPLAPADYVIEMSTGAGGAGGAGGGKRVIVAFRVIP